jgi:hypothetical protein
MGEKEVIAATYTWNEMECLDAHNWATRPKNQTGFGGLFKWIIGLMLFAFLFINLVVIFIESTKSTNGLANIEFWRELYFAWGESSGLWFLIFALFMFVFGLFWLQHRYVSPWLQSRYVKKHFSEHPIAETTVKVTIDDETITCEIGDETKTINKWKVFNKVVKTKGGFHFYIGDGYTWIPNHSFNSKDAILSLSHLAQKNSLSYEEIE